MTFFSNRARDPRSTVVSLIAAAGLALAAAPDARAADPIKLNDPLVAFGDVFSNGLQFSPDGSRVVYIADSETDNVTELFSVPSTGGATTKLNGPLVAGGGVAGLEFSPDSSRVLYFADQDTNNVFEVYSVPSTGGAATKLNGPLVFGGGVFIVEEHFFPDGNRVLYYADQDTDNVLEIYSVPSTGGAATKLNGPLVVGGDVASGGLRFSPDGGSVLYIADQETDEVDELYIVPGAGGVATKLNDPLVSGGDVTSGGLRFSPDGGSVLYVADQETNGVNELYSVPSAGGAATKLNGPLVAGGDVSNSVLRISPDGSRVVYVADQDTNNVFELYSVPSTGGATTKLNGAFVAGGNVSPSSVYISPDGARVLYRADQDTDEVDEIYSVPIAGGPATKLNGALVAGGEVSFESLMFSPDGGRVLYLADQDSDNVQELYSVPSTGGAATKLNGPLTDGGDVEGNSSGLQFSPDGSRVLYRADQDTDGKFELYSVPIAGGVATRINAALAPDADVASSGFQHSPDGSLVLYVADQDVVQQFEAYVRVVSQRAVAGGDWDSGATWNYGVAPDEVMQIRIDAPTTVTLTGAGTRVSNEITVGGGGAGPSFLTLDAGAEVTALNGVVVQSGGVIGGTGRIVGDLTVGGGGEVRVAGGESLLLGGAGHSNAGRVEAIGTASASAEIQFDGAVTNELAGEIFARNATLRFSGGLTNDGDVGLSFGVTDLFGAIDNTAAGVIIVSGASDTTFYDDVVNSGEFRTSAGSEAVFFGDVSGAGSYTGSGTVYYEGTFSPGASPAAVSIASDVVFGAAATLDVEIGGPAAGSEHDQINGTGDITLGGALTVSLIDAYTPAYGEAFEILSTTAQLSGAFTDQALPTLDPGLAWRVEQSATTVTLAVGLAGDFNADGLVDAADFTLWRDTQNATGFALAADGDNDLDVDADDYALWLANYGASAASLALAVPEPSTWLAFLTAIALAQRRSTIR